MKKILLIFALILLVFMCGYQYSMNGRFAGDEDLPRVFYIASQQF